MFRSADDFLMEVNTDSAGCLIVELNPPGLSATELQQHLSAQESSLTVIVFADSVDVRSAVSVMEAGALTLLQTPCCPNMLRDAVQRGLVASDQRWRTIHERRKVQKHLRRLNEEEREVMELLLVGKTNKEIATELVLSRRTVDRRRQAIMEKMCVSSLPALFHLMYQDRIEVNPLLAMSLLRSC